MDFAVVAPKQNDGLLDKIKPCEPCDWEPIRNIDDPCVQEMGRFAVMEHSSNLCGVGMTFIRVVSGATKAVLEGKKYRLLVEVTERIVAPFMECHTKFYVATVLDKQFHRSWKLLSFEPAFLPPFGSEPVIPNNA